MITLQLREYVGRLVDAQEITAGDVKDLQRHVLEDGISTREEAEVLVALDRLLPAHESWRDALVTLMVDFVVWGTRPTGKVGGDEARWLAEVFDMSLQADTAAAIMSAIAAETDGMAVAPSGSQPQRLAA